MNIEQTVEEMLDEAGIVMTLEQWETFKQALLSDPDITVVEKDKIAKMQRVLVGLLEDCKLNLEASGGCDHAVGLCVCGVISLIADAEELLVGLEVK